MTFGQELLLATAVFGVLSLYSATAVANAALGNRRMPKMLRLALDPENSAPAGRRAAALFWSVAVCVSLVGLITFGYVAVSRGELAAAVIAAAELIGWSIWVSYLVSRARKSSANP